MRRPRRSPRWLHHTYFSLHFPNKKKPKQPHRSAFALRQRLTLTLISKQTNLFTFAILNIAQLLSDCKGFLLSRIAKRAAKFFTCRFRASARMKSVCLQTQKTGDMRLGFFTLKERKVSAQELFSVRVLRSQNTYCRQSVSFATVFRSPTARALLSRPPARRRRAPRRRPACPRADRSR